LARRAQPLFLERSGYRQRRLMDAVRLIAIVGALLWLVPVLWPTGGTAETGAVIKSRALFYVFGVWAGLIVVAAVLAFRIRRLPAEPEVQETDQ
jgi:hypothetical protein